MPIIISVLTTPNNGTLQAIYRHKTDTIIRSIPAVPNKKDKILKQIRESFAEELKDARLTEVKDPAIERDLVNMEDRMLVKHYSFGVLYCKSGQKTEEEIFSNREEEVSENYLEFLSFIGDKVKLEGFPGPKVGLDTKSMNFFNISKFHFLSFFFTLAQVPIDMNDSNGCVEFFCFSKYHRNPYLYHSFWRFWNCLPCGYLLALQWS